MQSTQTPPQNPETTRRVELNRAYLPLWNDDHRWLVLYGGAGSGKSVFAAQKVLMRVLDEPGHRIACTRRVAKSQRDSCFALIRNLIYDWGVGSEFHIAMSDMRIQHLGNGNEILFLGMDDAEKIKSIWNISSFWHEEPTELTEEDLNQLNLRMRGRTVNYKQHILSFNPISYRHWIKRRFFDQDSDKVRILRTTWRDNAFIDNEYVQELESYRESDPLLYQVYALGEWGIMRGLVYRPFEMHLNGDWPETFDDTIMGLDFGFNNPTALVEIGLKDRNVFLTERLYETGMTNSDLIAWLRDAGISRSVPIYADSAEPDRIREIARAGFNVLDARKGQNSVQAGIVFCKALSMHTRPRNENINQEAASYRWRVDRNGESLDEPEKADDHAMDAVRYALFTHLSRSRAHSVDRRMLGI